MLHCLRRIVVCFQADLLRALSSGRLNDEDLERLTGAADKQQASGLLFQIDCKLAKQNVAAQL